MPHTSFTIPVFFVPDMVAHTNSYSPSAGKPEAVVRDWLSCPSCRSRCAAFSP